MTLFFFVDQSGAGGAHKDTTNGGLADLDKALNVSLSQLEIHCSTYCFQVLDMCCVISGEFFGKVVK